MEIILQKLKLRFKSQFFMFFLAIIMVSAFSAFKIDKASIHVTKIRERSFSVYVCDSKNSIAYHSSFDCTGLNRCVHDIIKISESQAKQIGLRRCKLCW
jgi:hypothetical protein